MPKTQLPYILSALIIPYDDFIRMKSCVVACANEGKYVAAEEHLDEADAAAIEHPADCLFERAAVEDLKPRRGTDGKTTLILVEPNIEHLICRRHRQVNTARPHFKTSEDLSMSLVRPKLPAAILFFLFFLFFFPFFLSLIASAMQICVDVGAMKD